MTWDKKDESKAIKVVLTIIVFGLIMAASKCDKIGARVVFLKGTYQVCGCLLDGKAVACPMENDQDKEEVLRALPYEYYETCDRWAHLNKEGK